MSEINLEKICRESLVKTRGQRKELRDAFNDEGHGLETQQKTKRKTQGIKAKKAIAAKVEEVNQIKSKTKKRKTNQLLAKKSKQQANVEEEEEIQLPEHAYDMNQQQKADKKQFSESEQQHHRHHGVEDCHANVHKESSQQKQEQPHLGQQQQHHICGDRNGNAQNNNNQNVDCIVKEEEEEEEALKPPAHETALQIEMEIEENQKRVEDQQNRKSQQNKDLEEEEEFINESLAAQVKALQVLVRCRKSVSLVKYALDLDSQVSFVQQKVPYSWFGWLHNGSLEQVKGQLNQSFIPLSECKASQIPRNVYVIPSQLYGNGNEVSRIECEQAAATLWEEQFRELHNTLTNRFWNTYKNWSIQELMVSNINGKQLLGGENKSQSGQSENKVVVVYIAQLHFQKVRVSSLQQLDLGNYNQLGVLIKQ